MKFPTYERRIGAQGGRVASFASGFSGASRGLQSIGNSIADVGASLQAEQDRIQGTQDDVWFSKARAETAQRTSEFETSARQQATGDASDYHSLSSDHFATISDQYLSEAPSGNARVMYEKWSNNFGSETAQRAGRFRAESELANRSNDFAQTMLSHSRLVLDDPTQYDDARSRALDDLEGAKQWMTPEQELEARNKVERDLQLSRHKSLINRDPDAFLREIGVAPEKIEFNDKKTYQPKNEMASQIIETARALGADPLDLATAISYETAGTFDPQKKGPRTQWGQHKGLIQYGEPQAAKYGVDWDNAAASQLGADGAIVKYLRDNGWEPGMDLMQMYSIINAGGPNLFHRSDANNGGAPGTVADKVKNQMSGHRQKAMALLGASGDDGGESRSLPIDVGDNPAFSHMSPDDVLSLYSAAQSSQNNMEKKERAAQTAELAQVKGAFQLGISTGDASVTPQAILSSQLPDSEKASLINSWNGKNSDNRNAAEYASRLSHGGTGLSVFSSDDRKGVSLAYDEASNGESLLESQEARQIANVVYERSGIVPSQAMTELRGGLISNDPSQVSMAGSISRDLLGANPDALAANPNGGELAKAGAAYKHMTERLGLSPDEAGQRMIDMRDPEKIRQRESLLGTESVKNKIKSVSTVDVRNLWDTLGPNVISGYKVGSTPTAEATMVSDYRDMLQESIVESAGDIELAEDLAAQRFKRIYGVSSLTGAESDTVTYLPPENFYPAVEQSYDYVRNQLVESLVLSGVEPDEGSVMLQASKQTLADVTAGTPPEYSVYYRKDGKLEQYPGSFRPDAGVAQAQALQRHEEQRNQRMKIEGARQEALKAQPGTMQELLDLMGGELGTDLTPTGKKVQEKPKKRLSGAAARRASRNRGR